MGQSVEHAHAAGASGSVASKTVPPIPIVVPTMRAASTIVGRAHYTIDQPRDRSLRKVSIESKAARAAEFRIATQSHVGPHRGPGSGADLGFMISRMHSRLEKLETWRDNSDTDSDG
jgi:hypothetical protein